jgi:hypothetical protein
MADKPLTGLKMAINGVGGAMKWSISEKADENKIVTSDSNGATDRVNGNTDWSGDYQALGYSPAALPGESFDGQFSIDGTQGRSGMAMVDSVEIVIDQEGNKPVEHTVKFSADGALTTGNVEVVIGTPTAKFMSKGLKVSMSADGSSFTDLERVRKVTLTLSAENSKIADSDTNGSYERLPGVRDWTASIDCYVINASALPRPNDIRVLRIYVTADLYFELKWGKFLDPGNLQVDASGTPVAVTLQCSMAAINGTTLGSVKLPGGTQWWPSTTSAPPESTTVGDPEASAVDAYPVEEVPA